jgi:hypothetical protein
MVDSKVWLSATLVAAFSLSACASGGGRAGGSTGELGSTTTAADYVPLKPGASWTYDVAYPGQNGEMTVTLVGEKDGFVIDDKNGAFRLTQDGLRDRDRYLIKHPLVAGTKWSSVVGPSAVEHAEIVSVGSPCETVGGAFADCLVVLSQIRRDASMSLRIRWTWAKGVGLAKFETEAEVQGKGVIPQVKQSLKHYALEGPLPEKKAAAPAGAGAPAKAPASVEEPPPRWER